jgi:hypothetical protein
MDNILLKHNNDKHSKSNVSPMNKHSKSGGEHIFMNKHIPVENTGGFFLQFFLHFRAAHLIILINSAFHNRKSYNDDLLW